MLDSYKKIVDDHKHNIEVLEGMKKGASADGIHALVDAIQAIKFLIPYPAVIHNEGKKDEYFSCPCCWGDLDPDEQLSICPECGQLVSWDEIVTDEDNRR